MSASPLTAFEPRKTPVQARATVTVDAIFEATIQILLTHGGDRLTTTASPTAPEFRWARCISTSLISTHCCLP